jgi:D-lyxose ketol-isomerase
MNRSTINTLIQDALHFFDQHQFQLPPWARWTPADWRRRGAECDEIRRNLLGWDLTDFGSGDFDKLGLLLFTIRNGNLKNPDSRKPYAEKIMIVRERQVTPMHFHWNKMEDIINRGGGELVIRLYHAATADEHQLGTQEFAVSVDGVRRACQAGEIIRLRPGESITLEPYVYHTFWAEGGMTLVGEVSMVNDDATDNCFFEPCGRFPSITEDVAPTFCLCTEYPAATAG